MINPYLDMLLLPSGDLTPPTPAPASDAPVAADATQLRAAIDNAKANVSRLYGGLYGSQWLGGLDVVPVDGATVAVATGVALVATPGSGPSGIDGVMRVEKAAQRVTVGGSGMIVLQYDATSADGASLVWLARPGGSVHAAGLVYLPIDPAVLPTVVPLASVDTSTGTLIVRDCRRPPPGRPRIVTLSGALVATTSPFLIPVDIGAFLLRGIEGDGAGVSSGDALHIAVSAVLFPYDLGAGIAQTVTLSLSRAVPGDLSGVVPQAVASDDPQFIGDTQTVDRWGSQRATDLTYGTAPRTVHSEWLLFPNTYLATSDKLAPVLYDFNGVCCSGAISPTSRLNITGVTVTAEVRPFRATDANRGTPLWWHPPGVPRSLKPLGGAVYNPTPPRIAT